MDEGEHVVFRQFVGVDPRLGVVNSDAFLPSPKQPVLMAHTEKQKENKEKMLWNNKAYMWFMNENGVSTNFFYQEINTFI